MSDTGKVDMNDPRANMFGCLPCPKCGSEYRILSSERSVIECDDCGLDEPITHDAGDKR